MKLEKVLPHEFRDDIYTHIIPKRAANIKPEDILKVNKILLDVLEFRCSEIVIKETI